MLSDVEIAQAALTNARAQKKFDFYRRTQNFFYPLLLRLFDCFKKDFCKLIFGFIQKIFNRPRRFLRN